MTKPTQADLAALAPPVDRALQDIEKRLIRERLAWGVLVAVLVAVDIGLLAALWWRW